MIVNGNLLLNDESEGEFKISNIDLVVIGNMHVSSAITMSGTITVSEKFSTQVSISSGDDNGSTVVMGIVRGAIVGKHREADLTLIEVSDFGGYELLSNFYTNGADKFTLDNCTITNDISTEINAGALIVKTENTTFNTYTVTKGAGILVDNAIAINGEFVVNTLKGKDEGAEITFGTNASCDKEIFYTAEGESPTVAAGTTYVWTMNETTNIGYWLAK